MANSIIGVQKAIEKLEEACGAHFQKKIADFDVSINPVNGKYVILANIHYKEFARSIPPEVDGYPVVTGFSVANLDDSK